MFCLSEFVYQSADLPTFEDTTYELSYNAGTTLAMRGKYSEALPVLKRAEQVCSESVIEDGGTEEEAKEEAAIIRYKKCGSGLITHPKLRKRNVKAHEQKFY